MSAAPSEDVGFDERQPTLSTAGQAALQLAEEYGIPCFPCRHNKRPHTEHGFKEATCNIERISEWWTRWPDALIGVPTGAPSKLLVVDVDPAGLDWYREYAEKLAAGRIHRTRREGYHLAYRMPAADIRNSTSKLAPGVDIRGEGGYVIWWPAHGCEAIGDIEDLSEPPAWLVEQLIVRPNGHDARRDDRAHDRDDGLIRQGGRNDYLSREAYRLRKQGRDEEQILEVLRALNKTTFEQPLEDGEIQGIVARKKIVAPDVQPLDIVRPESLTLDQMLERFVHVARGPMIVDAANPYRRLRPAEFAAVYAHDRIVIDKKAVPTTTLWAQSERRMLADCLTFHPGESQFFIERGLRNLNIWAPPTWPAADPADAAPLVDHLTYLIPDARQREDLLDWLAHAAQVPHIRPHHHFLLVAAQEGTGRSWLVEVLRRLWGERHAGETDLHRLLDDSFNSLLSGKILMAVHEVKAPAEERYSHRDRLKSLLTDSTITINEKHEPRWSERFCARFLMFTNRDDALPLSETDRRVYAVRCADQPREATYYTRLYSIINDETFLASVWHMLRTRGIGRFNPGARAPLNEIKSQMIAAGRTEEQQTAAELVRACPYDVISSNDLMQSIAPPLEGERPADRRVRTNAIAAVLREIGCQTYPKKVRVREDVTRVWILRRAAHWSAATPAAVRQEAQGAHEDIAAFRWTPDTIIERWQAGTR